LIIAVGSTQATHGADGLKRRFQLETILDALAIRRRILGEMPFPNLETKKSSFAHTISFPENFEAASLPTTTSEERKRLLSFVVCGGGSTGIETAAEIYDLCQEDIVKYYPKVCGEEVSIHVIQSREHILNTYSEAISKYAEVKTFVLRVFDYVTDAAYRTSSIVTVSICSPVLGQ
jgi:NADH dehydrogenase FAD-containing subunit